MLQGFSGWHALIILVVILLLFGAPKLPALARSLGQSMKILKNEVRNDGEEAEDGEAKPAAEEKKLTKDAAPADSKPKTGPGSDANA